MPSVARYVALLGVVVVVSSGLAPAARAADHGSSATAVRQLDRTVRLATRHSTAGHLDYRIHVAGVGTVSRHATTRTAPASNEKLLTGLTALQTLGPDFHYTTTVYATGPVGLAGTLPGDLVLRGSGDPTLTTAALHTLAKHLYRAGLRRVSGNLVVDDSRYGHRTIAPGWKHSFVPIESGPVDAFTVNHNTWRTGATFRQDPSHANAGLWRTALRKVGIHVVGRTRIGREPTALVALASHRSGPLSEILTHTLTTSDNFYAEMLLREIGARRSGRGTLASGIAAIRALGHRLGIDLGTMHDGSGLSYTDRESPRIVVRWLRAAQQLPNFATFENALPKSCRSGTLQHRLCGGLLAGRVHAKTGSLDHITALSGYTTTRSGRNATFSFLVSGARNVTTAMSRVNAAVRAVVRSS